MSGYNWNTKLEVMHASYHYGGAQIPTSWDLQESVHTNLLLGHLQLGDIVGRHLKHCIDYLYLLIDIPERVMSYPFAATANLAIHTWISNTWDYMSEIGATLVMSSLYLPSQRQHDTSIMSSIIPKYRTKSNKHGTTLARINAVHLYRQVFYISDMTTSDGQHISSEYLDEALPIQRDSTLNWPFQEAPGPRAWAEWRTMLSSLFTTGTKFKLRQPLGHWNNVKIRTQTWHTLINPTTSNVYVKCCTLWHLYRLPTRARTTFSYVDVHPSGPPSTALPITLQPHRRRPHLLVTLPHVQQVTTPAPPTPSVTNALSSSLSSSSP